MKINCLETAKKAYKDDLDNKDIESVYDALARHRKLAEHTGANILEEMNNFSKELMDEHERAANENMLQQLMSMQSIVDSLQREELFRKAGFSPENSVRESIMSKIVGTSWKVARSRDNTATRAMQASDGFYREFANDLQGELMPLFTSKTSQVQLADAMYTHRRTGKPVEGAFGKLSTIILKYQNRMYDKLRSVGIDITELDDRIAPNIHNEFKMTKLLPEERKEAQKLFAPETNVLTGEYIPKKTIYGKEIGDPAYEYAYQKWNEFILPLIDHKKVFEARNVDPTDARQVDAFQRHSFDNLANRGKATQRGVNFANKFQQSRVYHWKDGESLVKYNEQYGSGAIQDSILRELAHQFKMIEVVKDWGVNPAVTLDRILKIMDINDATNQRLGKEKEKRILNAMIDNLTAQDIDYPGTMATIFNSLKAAEVITKMGSVAVTSTQDAYNVVKVARSVGASTLSAIGNSVKSVVLGMPEKDKKLLYKYVNTGLSNKLGSVARSEINAWEPTSYMSKGIHFMYKLNILERADNGNRMYIASVISQHMADNRGKTWDMLPQSDKESLGSYGIEAVDWEFFRQSDVKLGSKNKKYITPDSIQEMPNEKVKSMLEAMGIENPSETKIQMYKDSIERKFTTYFRDRIDHAVITPDLYDKYLLSFGVPREWQTARLAISLFTQFKMFQVAQLRKTGLPEARAGGARTNMEMLPFSGKGNWPGIAKMTAATMAAGYMAASLKNAISNQTPPSLDKWSTWKKMLQSSNMILDMVLGVDPKSWSQTFNHLVSSPVLSDIFKVSKLGTNIAVESYKGKGYTQTKKSFYDLVKSNIPYNTFYLKPIHQHMWLNAMEDWAYPGKRQKDLRRLTKDTGAKQLF